MKINLDSESDDIRIEIVPLIDVIFCILTFFILAALQFTRQQAINVDLPGASTSSASQMRDMLIVRIDAPDGQIYVDDGVNQPEPIIAPDQLREKLQQYRQARPDGLMVLYANKDVKYNDVVQVLDQMRQVGGDRVALATLPQSPNQVPTLPGVPSVPGVPGVNPIPPQTGVPGLYPPGGTTPAIPYNPYGTTTPTLPYNPNQPQLPGQPGVNPAFPTPGVPPTGGAIAPAPTPVPGTGVAPGQTPSR